MNKPKYIYNQKVKLNSLNKTGTVLTSHKKENIWYYSVWVDGETTGINGIKQSDLSKV